jgi:hypothetical protein
MKVAVHQIAYWPWRGFLEKWRRADLLIVLDTVQFEKGGWQNRCRLPSGQWLTVPVRQHRGQRLDAVEIDGDHWRRKHAATLRHRMGPLPERVAAIYARPWTHLVPLALETMQTLAPDRPWCWASALPVTETDRTGRLVALCRAVGATTYLHGAGAAAYLDPQPFRDAGLALEAVTGVWPPYTALAA